MNKQLPQEAEAPNNLPVQPKKRSLEASLMQARKGLFLSRPTPAASNQVHADQINLANAVL
jgi:hypothetical protein